MHKWMLILFSVVSCIEIDWDTTCPFGDPPLPGFLPKCRTEDIVLLKEVYASSVTKKGVFQILNHTAFNYQDDEPFDDHLSLMVYPTDLDSCKGECGIIQRIDNTGKLLTPQLYTNAANQLLLLIYGYGNGKVLAFDRKLKSYTWQEIVISLSEDYVRICVNSIFSSHCHQFTDPLLEYHPNGAWYVGGSHHRHGMPGFITDVRLIPSSSHLARKYEDIEYTARKLKHYTPPVKLPVAEMFYLCKAHEVNKITNVLKLSDNHFYTEDKRYVPCTACPVELHEQVHAAVVRRSVVEAALVHQQIKHHLNCSDSDIVGWLKEKISKMKQSTLPEDMRTLGSELLLTSDEHCKAVVMLLLSSCHGNPETLFSLASFLKTGVILKQNKQLAYELTMVAATQKSVLANSALAFASDTCPLKYAYYGVVAEMYMEAWKEVSGSEDLISDRTRLHHGELGQQNGETDQVFQFLLMQAQQGNAEAQANVGRMYYWGQGGVDRNIEEAFNMQQAAAQQNHPDALFDTGVMLMKGQGVPQNNTKARVLLEKAAKVGHKSALGTLGYLELHENNNITGAVHYFNTSHHLGDTDATHNLAVIQSFYTAFDKDPYYAHKMFKIAAERGHRDAALMAGEQCLQGVHEQQGDCSAALRYIQMLSDNSNLVTRKMREGCKHFQNAHYDQAALQYLILAEAGVEMAAYNIAWLCEEFPAEIKYEIPGCKTRYYGVSAELGHGPAQAYYGNYLWSQGRYYEAARWYQKSAENNEAEGLFGLGYFSKLGVPVGVVTVNATDYYFGPEANTSLTKELWYSCFQMGADDSIFGCGVPLLGLYLTTFSLYDVSVILLQYTLTILIIAFGLSRLGAGRTLNQDNDTPNDADNATPNVTENDIPHDTENDTPHDAENDTPNVTSHDNHTENDNVATHVTPNSNDDNIAYDTPNDNNAHNTASDDITENHVQNDSDKIGDSTSSP